MRESALQALRGSDLILHAGDIGSAEVLAALRTLAPVVAIRGNNDIGVWAQALPEMHLELVVGQRVAMIHDLKGLTFDSFQAPIHAVICGHSHKPQITIQSGMLIVNPGSAGPRRFRLPISVGRLTLANGQLSAEILTLE